jgi:hypothetical protein
VRSLLLPARPSTRPDTPPLGGHHADVRRLRSLLRDRQAREADGVFVCEGPRVIAAALDQGAALVECFVGVDASGSAARTMPADNAARKRENASRA